MTAYGPIGKLRSALFDRLNVSAVTDLLSGQSADSIYWLTPGDSPGKPYIVYELHSGGDENRSSTRTRNVVLAVKAVADTAGAAEQIDEQIDARLHDQTLTISGWDTVTMAREDDLATTEDNGGGGANYVIGGYYRIRVSKT